LSNYYKILLVIIALAYLASPIDLIPDLFVPFLGFVDDAFLMGLVIYYLRFSRLPNFLYKTRKGNGASTNGQTGYSDPQGSIKKEPHEILEIDRNATKEEIQAAYRKAVKQYHPDKVARLGKELQDLANKKFIEIQAAYQQMMKKLS